MVLLEFDFLGQEVEFDFDAVGQAVGSTVHFLGGLQAVALVEQGLGLEHEFGGGAQPGVGQFGVFDFHGSEDVLVFDDVGYFLESVSAVVEGDEGVGWGALVDAVFDGDVLQELRAEVFELCPFLDLYGQDYGFGIVFEAVGVGSLCGLFEFGLRDDAFFDGDIA